MSLSNNFPTINPTLNLDFANVGRLDPRITFTRASTATYFDYAGVLRTAQNNIARFDYNPSTLAPQGLLIEEARTNICLQSEDLSTTWTTQAAIVSANAAVGLDGTLTADKVVANSTFGYHGANQSISVVSGTTYTFSVFAKAAGNNFLRVSLSSARFGSNVAYFNLATGAIGTVTGATAAIVNAGNNWYRCSTTVTAISTGASTHSLIYTSQSDNQNQYTGDDVSGLIAWGAQFEAGSFATSYIPTTTTALTRSADVASMTGTNFSSWYNAVEGTLFAQSQTAQAYAAGVPARVSIDDGTITNRIAIRNGNNFSSVVSISGSSVAGLESGAWNSNIAKQAIAYKVDDFAYTTNGASVVTDALGAIPSVNRLGIGLTGTQNYLNGYIQRIAYYPTRLANAQLQALTG